jgi:putative toxin-antitoxin system antitoxin component (TIGR02293 family)
MASISAPPEHFDLTRVVPVIAHAVAVFGDEHKATHWLSTPLTILNDRTPAEVLKSDEGIAQVEQILTRIEHNIPS